MSLSYEKLDVIEVRDPRTIISNKRDYAILKGGQQVTMKPFTTTNISTSSIQFSCPPPSGQTIIDRKMYMVLPLRLTLTGAVVAGPGNLINPGQDAPRAFPLSSMIDTLQVTINNISMSIQMADVVQALMRYNGSCKLDESDYSMSPCYQDQSQGYAQLFGSNRNPLGFYGDSLYGSCNARGGFPFTVVSNTTTQAVIDMVICEPLYLSPFYWGHSNSSGFYNVNTMDFNITFLGNAGFRAWSHDALSLGTQSNITGASIAFNGFSSFSYQQTQPLMLFNYITPQETQLLPSMVTPISYPYFDVVRFPTDTNISLNPYNGIPNEQMFVSNNIQLSSIPRRMYIYLRQNNNILYTTCNFTDTFLAIDNISIQFNNKTGLLNSANKRQLYEMCVKNHCSLSWPQWSGESLNQDGAFNTYNPLTTPPSYNGYIAGVGSVLCIEFATDIGLPSLDAPGKIGQYNLQVQVNAHNIAPTSITPTLYIVVVNEGTFTIEGLGKASTNIGVISSTDILNSHMAPQFSYKDVEEVNGGNFLSGIKDFGKNIFNVIKKLDDTAKNIRMRGMNLVPTIARSIGFGEGASSGGVLLGGEGMDRKKLKHRIMQQ